MNSNLWQTIMTVITGISGAVTMILLNMGCRDSGIAGQALDCSTSTAPTWLTPYLGAITMGLVVIKLLIAAFEGKLTAPTVAVPKSKAPSQ